MSMYATRSDMLEPCPTCAALARTVMLDQVSFDRKPDCYGIHQITDDEGVEEWEDIRTSPDVAREEAYDMMATGRGEIYEVVPLWTTPKPTPAQAVQLNPDMPTQELRLHMGELTTDEVLVARAAIRWANSQQEARVPLSSKECRGMLEEADPYNFAIDLIRAVEKHHGITAAQK